jgi:hypothetical protein
MQDVAYEDIESKERKRAMRMLRSETARRRRRVTKQVRETRLLNEYARQRRIRKRR